MLLEAEIVTAQGLLGMLGMGLRRGAKPRLGAAVLSRTQPL